MAFGNAVNVVQLWSTNGRQWATECWPTVSANDVSVRRSFYSSFIAKGNVLRAFLGCAPVIVVVIVLATFVFAALPGSLSN